MEELVPGQRVEFKIMAGDRGRKAFAAHLIADGSDLMDESTEPPQSATITPRAPLPSPPPARAQLAPTPDDVAAEALDEEQMCDVLSPAEFGAELTELLLNNIPMLTGPQIVAVRQNMLDFARKHGWVDI